MFGRQSGLFMVAAYAIVLLVLGASARLAFVYYNQSSSSPIVAAPEPPDRRVPLRGTPGTAAIHYDYAAVAAANERLATLQSNLERTTTQLQAKSKLLNQRNAECRALEEKLDESVAFAMELLVQEPSADREVQTRDVKAKLEGDLTSLRKQLRESQVLSDEHTERLDAVRLDLMQADREIASLRERAEREIAALIGERLAIEVAAGEVLVQLGEGAVPPLTALLRHPQAEVRLWSATVLGKLGLNATTAIEPLNNLTNDPDTRVAAAARRALTLIEP
ncbi:MAG: HEAT repeat domain-containing protein [Planctomycetota bacterium]|nr:HEAT repeat domain-containing protein [Planctomycetota bacterium]